jgi:hypothetical protein
LVTSFQNHVELHVIEKTAIQNHVKLCEIKALSVVLKINQECWAGISTPGKMLQNSICVEDFKFFVALKAPEVTREALHLHSS